MYYLLHFNHNHSDVVRTIFMTTRITECRWLVKTIILERKRALGFYVILCSIFFLKSTSDYASVHLFVLLD